MKSEEEQTHINRTPLLTMDEADDSYDRLTRELRKASIYLRRLVELSPSEATPAEIYYMQIMREPLIEWELEQLNNLRADADEKLHEEYGLH